MFIYIYIYDISSLRVNQLLYCVFLKIYNKIANYFCELKFSGNTHPRLSFTVLKTHICVTRPQCVN